MTRCESYPPCFGTIYFPTAPSCIFFQFNTIYCIFIIDLLYILCYYDIVFKFCVIPL